MLAWGDDEGCAVLVDETDAETGRVVLGWGVEGTDPEAEPDAMVWAVIRPIAVEA